MEEITRKWNAFSLLVLALGLGWIWTSARYLAPSETGQLAFPMQGFLSPDFKLPNMAGEQVSLSSFKGFPVLINFWASWCSPCKTEMPAMQKVYETYQERGLVILAINTTYQDQPEQVQQFVNDLGLSFPILYDHNGDVSKIYQVRAMPTSLFVNPQGIIREIVIGGPMSEALLRTRIENLWDVR